MTPRAVVIALLLIPPNAYWVTQMAVVRYEGHPTTVSLFFNTIFALLLLLGVNALLRRVAPRFILHRNELLVIYLMLCLASALVSHDMIQVQCPEISYPYQFASPENKWEDLFFKFLPEHLIIRDQRVLDAAYDGSTSLYTAARLRAWGGPVLWWTAFITVLCGMLLCMNALLRKRWMESEKLNYPITHLPLEMTAGRSPLLLNRWMWAGFALAASINIVNGLHTLYPGIPLIKVRVIHYDQYMQSVFSSAPWVALRGTRISFYPFAVGMGLLLPQDLLFSCWFFYLFWRAQHLISFIFGWRRIRGFPFVREQSSAAYIGLCLFALWTSRQHLAQLWSHLVGLRRMDDRKEPVGTSAAAAGLVLGMVFLFFFSAKIGMSPWLVLVFFALYFMISLAVTRIRAELGPPAHDLHAGGPDYILTAVLGTQTGPLGPRNLMAMTAYFWFNRAYRGHPMPHQLEAFKIADVTGMSMKRLAAALTLTSVVGTLAAYWAQIHCYHVYGMNAKMSFVANIFGREPYVRLQSWMQAPEGPQPWAIGAYIVGLVFTIVLMALRMRFVWWPFHPVGYAVSSSWSMNCLWLPLLIAWIIKVVTIRYGGPKKFQQAIPAALGLILGEFVVGSIWAIVGLVFRVNTYAFWV